MNKVCIVGRLIRDPEMRYNGDTGIVRFNIAVDRKFKNKEGKYESDFINCVAFGKTAEFIGKYFQKGMKIGITGRIQTGSYTNKEGQKTYTTDVVAEDAEFVEKRNDNNVTSNDTNVTNDGFTNIQTDNDGFANVDSSMADELPFN